MLTTIDQAGRVVIPKKVRDSLHLLPGTMIEMEQENGGVFLRVHGATSSLVEEEGFLVHHGPGAVSLNIAEFINQQRENRAAETTPPRP